MFFNKGIEAVRQTHFSVSAFAMEIEFLDYFFCFVVQEGTLVIDIKDI